MRAEEIIKKVKVKTAKFRVNFLKLNTVQKFIVIDTSRKRCQ